MKILKIKNRYFGKILKISNSFLKESKQKSNKQKLTMWTFMYNWKDIDKNSGTVKDWQWDKATL